MRSLSAILQDLESWRRGQCPDDRVRPLNQGGETEQNRMRDALERGLARARAGVRYIAPDRIQPDQIDSDTAESLALGLIVQTTEFMGLPPDATWRQQDVKRARIAYKLMRRLEPFLASHPAGADRRPTIRAMEELRSELKRALTGGETTGKAAPRGRHETQPDTEEEEVTGEFGMLGGETEDTLDAVLSPRSDSIAAPVSEDALEQILTGEIPEEPSRERRSQVDALAEEDQEDLIARAVDSSRREPGTATLVPESGSSRFQIGATLLLVIMAAAALVSLVPHLMSANTPSVDSYSEHLPVIGMARLAEPEPTLVLIVDETWAALSGPERRARSHAAFSMARDRESVSVLIVRDESGREVVRATTDEVSLHP